MRTAYRMKKTPATRMYREAKEEGNFSVPSRHGRHLGAIVNGNPASDAALQ